MRKNLFLLSFIVLFVQIASAQSTRIAFEAGATASTMFSKVAGEKHTGDYIYGATFGFLFDVPMQKYGSFRIGINYTQKGQRDVAEVGNQTQKVRTRLNYVETPVDVVFRIPMKGGSVLVGAGIAPAFNTSGKRIYEQGGNSQGTQNIPIGDKNTDELNWVDLGIDGILGYEFNNGFFITATYNYGLNRLYNGGPEVDKLYNRYGAIRIGYLIKGKKKKD
jgi:hypothetical protein